MEWTTQLPNPKLIEKEIEKDIGRDMLVFFFIDFILKYRTKKVLFDHLARSFYSVIFIRVVNYDLDLF